MSIFKTKLKTFKSKITGEEREYKVNTAFWIYLDEDYGIKQGNIAEVTASDNALTNAKIVTSILKANKLDVTLNEVVENVDEVALTEFVNDFYNALVEQVLDEVDSTTENISDAKKEGKQKR